MCGLTEWRMGVSGVGLVVCLSLGVGAPAFGDSGVAPGEMFQVNSITTYYQLFPQVATSGDGDFVVVWGHDTIFAQGPDGALGSTEAQRYDSTGCPIGGQFTVNTVTLGDEFPSSVAMHSDGSFVVAFSHTPYPQYPGFYPTDARLQRFDSTGTPVGDEVLIDEDSGGAGLVMDDMGRFTVLWRDPLGVRTRLYDPDGVPLASEVLIENDQLSGLGLASDGQFFGVWSDRLNDFNCNILGQRFDSLGMPVDEPFQVNTTTVGCSEAARPTYLKDDRVVVVWQRGPGQGRQLLGQVFDSQGAATGEEFEINTYATDIQSRAVVAADPISGGFVVNWTRRQSNDTRWLLARRFDASGDPMAAEFRVTEPGETHNQINGHDVVIEDDGEIIFVWNQKNFATIEDEVYARRVNPVHIFADRFESGDLDAWSEVVSTGGF